MRVVYLTVRLTTSSFPPSPPPSSVPLFQANSDEPPYLTVGTEVSAKYRGAFCEATIKIAKKLVKCKVSN